MQHERLLCLDIETVPDRELIPPDWGDRFPKPAWHEVVAISFVEAGIEAEGQGERYRVRCCRSGGEASWDEARLLASFWRNFGSVPTRVVTWNGRGFDMPVLRLRALIHGVQAGAWYGAGTRFANYTQRYSPDWHCDLMEQLSDYGACARMGLDEVARAMGLPGKLGGRGSEVADMVSRGDVEAVRAYCEADVMNLYGLYVRWALLTGRTDRVGHDVSMESLASCLADGRAMNPHHGEFLDTWLASRRPMPMLIGGGARATVAGLDSSASDRPRPNT